MNAEHARLLDIKTRAAAELMPRDGVTAVGLGGRERAGRPTGEVVIKVFVARKRPLADLSPGEALPETFEGVGIDVAQMPESEPDTEPVPDEEDDAPDEPLGSPRVPRGKGDDDRYRPLLGGVRIQTSHSSAGTGTLGCVLVHRTNPARVFALTNFHIVDSGAEETEAGVTRVGQPTNFSSSTKCCSRLFGTFVAGDRDEVRDAALIELDAGTQWMAEIVDAGVVAGVHPITIDEATSQTYSVHKRGAKTRHTGGIVQAIDATYESPPFTRHNGIIIRPKFNPAIPDDEVTYFADHGDSGAAILNEDNEVVGIHVRGALDEDLGVRNGIGLPIAVVLTLFEETDGIPVEVATEDESGIVHTAAGEPDLHVPEELTRILAPPGMHRLPGVGVPDDVRLAEVRARLSASPAGRAVAALWLEYSDELVSLVNNDRRVAVVWHRCGGPALVQSLIRMTERPDLALPATVNGQPLSVCVDRLHDTFGAKASPDLSRALGAARDALPDLAGLTYPAILAALEEKETTAGGVR